jgi:hypothetical protein
MRDGTSQTVAVKAISRVIEGKTNVLPELLPGSLAKQAGKVKEATIRWVEK